ncbi:MAG TPA: hypothetical protein H9684_07665 [Firmicutes bacterium]|nr:hypothetical protein [Bacillota bacterium]
MLEGSYQLGLSDLLDQNLSCYEYFHGLPRNIQEQIERRDIGSFQEMQDFVARRMGRSAKEEQRNG